MLKRGEEALIKVAEWLEAGAPHTSVYDGKYEIVQFDMTTSVDHQNGCGTVCCIAGAVSQFERLIDEDITTQDIDDYFLEDNVIFGSKVQKYLGLTEDQRDKLFIPWEYFGRSYEYFSNPQRAAKVIRHLIATGEVDWDKFN